MTESVILDPDAFSYLVGKKPQASGYDAYLRGKLPCLTFVSVGELLFGAQDAAWGPARIVDLRNSIRKCVILPYSERLSELWADVKVDAKRNGRPLAHSRHSNDLWIAACGIYYRAPLLTGNVKHFRDVPGLEVVDGSGS